MELACAVSAKKALATEKQARRPRARGSQKDWEEPDVEVIEDADDDAPDQVGFARLATLLVHRWQPY